MKVIIIIFIISILAFVPICFTSIGISTWSNSMAWRVMDSIDPYISNDARMVKQEMSDWLDLQPREKKYDEEYTSGCYQTLSKKIMMKKLSKNTVRRIIVSRQQPGL